MDPLSVGVFVFIAIAVPALLYWGIYKPWRDGTMDRDPDA